MLVIPKALGLHQNTSTINKLPERLVCFEIRLYILLENPIKPLVKELYFG